MNVRNISENRFINLISHSITHINIHHLRNQISCESIFLSKIFISISFKYSSLLYSYFNNCTNLWTTILILSLFSRSNCRSNSHSQKLKKKKKWIIILWFKWRICCTVRISCYDAPLNWIWIPWIYNSLLVEMFDKYTFLYFIKKQWCSIKWRRGRIFWISSRSINFYLLKIKLVNSKITI